MKVCSWENHLNDAYSSKPCLLQESLCSGKSTEHHKFLLPLTHLNYWGVLHEVSHLLSLEGRKDLTNGQAMEKIGFADCFSHWTASAQGLLIERSASRHSFGCTFPIRPLFFPKIQIDDIREAPLRCWQRLEGAPWLCQIQGQGSLAARAVAPPALGFPELLMGYWVPLDILH